MVTLEVERVDARFSRIAATQEGNMKIWNFVMALTVPLFASASHAGESAPAIAGFLNPQTGAFTPRLALTPAAAPVAAAATLTVTFTVKINSSIPRAQPITCALNISSYDASFANYATADSYVVKSSASAGTCTVSIPYIWQIATTATTMNLHPGVSTTFAAGGLYRSSSASVAPFPVPTTGTKKIAVTLAL
ncbi:hypothetical protein [Methylosinus sp. Sm6]|uniref:hypothetical protein n=1 Tax=Methylosinus sp. Sm6 TaxID=2866948 RepID=UPI001C9960AF|nr:hypothetical protein [Methylosinus sp. Sm6]MBY6241711.1 hypothetical protein [Methylosinus sp. Sm6]